MSDNKNNGQLRKDEKQAGHSQQKGQQHQCTNPNKKDQHSHTANCKDCCCKNCK